MAKRKNPTSPHTNISCGKLEVKILKYLLKLNEERFNIKACNRVLGENRSNIYDALSSLIKKGLVIKPHYGQHILTDKGKDFLSSVGHDRTVCRESPEPSIIRDHKFTFKIPIKSRPNGWGDAVGMFDSKGIQTRLNSFSKNNKILYANFPNDVASATFTSTHVLIKPKNIFGNDHSEAVFQAISKTYEVINYLLDIGFGFTNDKGILPLIQTEGHYAEVNSALAQFFEKTAKGFSVQGSDGKTLFWVDHSNGHLEDETASEESRERLGKHMRDVMQNDLPTISELSEDLTDLKKITADLVKLQMMGMQQPKPDLSKLGRPDYFG